MRRLNLLGIAAIAAACAPLATNHALYTDDLIPAAERWSEEGEFVALYGQEVSSIGRGTHVNVFDVGEVVDVPNGEFDVLIQWLSDHRDSSGLPALMQLNHPTV